MFAAHPPRRTSRSSTRKDSAILSSCSTTKESANRPGKDIRWSVATEPVTAMGTGTPYRRLRPRGFRQGLVERVSAGAGAGGGRVVDGEALLLDRVDEVD